MQNFEIKKTLVLLAFMLLAHMQLKAQDIIADTLQEISKPTIYLRISGGPAVIAIDPGYYFQNELIADLSKNFSIIASYGTGNAYAGFKDVQRWYLPDAQYSDDDLNRHQSVLSFNAGLQLSFINTHKHRLYMGMGPGMNFYNYSEGSIVPYGQITVYKLSNKHTLRMALNYYAGYEFKTSGHILFGIGFYGSQFTETLYSIMISTGYRFGP